MFAGARKQADAERIVGLKLKHLRPVLVDVTDSAQVAAAVAEVGAALQQLKQTSCPLSPW